MLHSVHSIRCIGCLFLALFLAPMPAAWAAPNCDMRQLDLSPIQKAKLRLIRMKYKNTVNNHAPATTNNRHHVVQILTRLDFDENQARRHMTEKYGPHIQREVDELRVQHAFLQVLNPQQRQDWLQNCLR